MCACAQAGRHRTAVSDRGVATRVQRGATEEGAEWARARSVRQTTGEKIEYSNCQPLDRSATQEGVTPGTIRRCVRICADRAVDAFGSISKPRAIGYWGALVGVALIWSHFYYPVLAR